MFEFRSLQGKRASLTRDVTTGCRDTLLQEAVSAVHCAAAGFTSVQLKGKSMHMFTRAQLVKLLCVFFFLRVTHTYRAEGPTTDARNADTTPEPLPTSKHTHGLQAAEKKKTLKFKISG